jgi:hypothetical protein
MKFTLTFKTPGVLDVVDELPEDQVNVALTLADKFVKWDEYVKIEFDTVAQTATVLKV